MVSRDNRTHKLQNKIVISKICIVCHLFGFIMQEGENSHQFQQAVFWQAPTCACRGDKSIRQVCLHGGLKLFLQENL